MTGIMLILLLALLFATFGAAVRTAPRIQNPTHIQATSQLQKVKAVAQLDARLHPSTLVPQVDKLMAGWVANQQFSGSLLIARDDEVLLSKGYGMADWDHHVSNTAQTTFYLGSITKQFTATSIMILQERGKLHVQDHLCSYITNCPAAWQPITLHHLLTHTSGIPFLNSAVPLSSPQDWFARYNNVPLAFSAGTQFNYCNVCYQILGYVIQKVTGEPYNVFVQHEILDRLQMKSTSFEPDYLSLPNHAVGYQSWKVAADDDDWPVPSQMSFLWASGLLHTTVEDLYRWDQALYTNTVISQQSLKTMYTSYAPSEFSSSSYGYGWFITKSAVSHHRLIWHYGSIDGFTTYIGRYPDDKVTIIFLSNLQTLDYLTLASSLEKIVFTQS